MLNYFCRKDAFFAHIDFFCYKNHFWGHDVLFLLKRCNFLHMFNFSAERTTSGPCWIISPERTIFCQKCAPFCCLNHVESGSQKICPFQLSCWICWIFLDTVKVCPDHCGQKHSAYSTYSTWQQKEAHFLESLIQHDSTYSTWQLKEAFLNKICFFQLSCWILGGFSVGPGLVHQIDGRIPNISSLWKLFTDLVACIWTVASVSVKKCAQIWAHLFWH